MRRLKITVITGKCLKTPSDWMVVGITQVAFNQKPGETMDTFEKRICAFGEKLVTKGVAVVVRPDYNHTPHRFSEWRSFDGEPLKKLSW